MKIRTVALVAGGALVIALGGIGAVACSSDTGTGTPGGNTNNNNGGADATTDAKGNNNNNGTDSGNNNTGTDSGNNNTGDDGGTPDTGGGGADCGSPGSLHPVDAGTGPYCPFSSTGDAGNQTCAQGEHCCETPADAGTPSKCAASCATSPTGTIDWECQDPNNCGTGKMCCAITTGAGQETGCTSHFLHQFKGTTCRTSCQAGEIPVCESDSQCTAVKSDGGGATTCQVTKAKGANFGLCL